MPPIVIVGITSRQLRVRGSDFFIGRTRTSLRREKRSMLPAGLAKIEHQDVGPASRHLVRCMQYENRDARHCAETAAGFRTIMAMSQPRPAAYASRP